MSARGFTLLELLVVLAIMALVAAVAFPLISRALPGVEVRAAARDLAAGLRYARSQAILGNREATFTLDVEGRRYAVNGMPDTVRRLPSDLEIRMLTARSEQLDESIANIRFFPDGSSTGGRITLRGGSDDYDVSVDWITGRISVAR